MQSDDDLDRFNQSRRRDSTLGRLGREENTYPLRDSIMPIGIVCKSQQDLGDVAAYVAAMPRKLENGVGPGTNLSVGKKLYEKDCQSCHRDDGRGRADGAFPIIVGQHFGYLCSQIRDMALKRRRNSLPAMVGVISQYSPEELVAVSDYLSPMQWPETQDSEY